MKADKFLMYTATILLMGFLLASSLYYHGNILMSELDYLASRDGKETTVAKKKNGLTVSRNKRINPGLIDNLFGKHEAPEEVFVETSIKLKGIYFSESNDRSFAIIEEKKGAEKIYFKGEKLPNGGVIKTILQDHLLLVKQGRTFALYLPWETEVSEE